MATKRNIGANKHEQMDCDPPASKVIDSKNTANDIASKIIKDKYLPHRVAIFIQ